MTDINIHLKNCRGHPRFYELLEEIARLHHNKNTDYATKEDPLRNFTSVGKLTEHWKLTTTGRAAFKDCVIYSLKQLDAAMKLVAEKEEGVVEGVGARLKDVAVYMLIATILYEEGK